MRILLFDVDGVLVHARGYRAALMRTVDWFAARMGLEGMTPSSDDVDVFEANGLTSEWESCPLCVAAILLTVLETSPDLQLTGDLSNDLAAVAATHPAIARPDYAALARQVGQDTPIGERPSQATEILLAAHARQALQEGQFPGCRAALHMLFQDTHDLRTAWVSQIFQHFSLGSATYARCYSQPIQVETPSLLATLDVPALLPESRERLRQALANGQTRAAIYTARPSLPPVDGLETPTGYAPEGEVARDLAGLAELPLIGFGRVQWLATQVGARPDAFVKPSPLQALAAIGAAWSGQEKAALEAAYEWMFHGRRTEPLLGLTTQPEIEVVVLEDAASGVCAVAAAVTLLNREAGPSDSRVHLYSIGITGGSEPKRLALQPVCDTVVSDINQAFDVLAL